MRLLFVVQRYGLEVAGGAERCCREYASRLAARGHDVHVLTSCAQNYTDWANHYPPGEQLLEGVHVHRLPVSAPREALLFPSLDTRVVASGRFVPLYAQEAWMRLMGPTIPNIGEWLIEHAGSGQFDCVIFYTYLYYTTWAGLQALGGRPGVRTVFVPTAHQEPYMALELFDEHFCLADGYQFLTEEEQSLVRGRFGRRRPEMVTGIGVDLDAARTPTLEEVGEFRSRFGLGDRPFLLFIGRIDPHKGVEELWTYFLAYRQRHRGDGDRLALVLMGEAVMAVPEDSDIIVTGFVSDDDRNTALHDCTAFVISSYFESFSMVLTEAWAHGRPALVQGGCDVLAGQARRSGGALPYSSFAEFEAEVELLVNDPVTAAAIGQRGRAYVEQRYEWDGLLTRYEEFLAGLR